MKNTSKEQAKILFDDVMTVQPSNSEILAVLKELLHQTENLKHRAGEIHAAAAKGKKKSTV